MPWGVPARFRSPVGCAGRGLSFPRGLLPAIAVGVRVAAMKIAELRCLRHGAGDTGVGSHGGNPFPWSEVGAHLKCLRPSAGLAILGSKEGGFKHGTVYCLGELVGSGPLHLHPDGGADKPV